MSPTPATHALSTLCMLLPTLSSLAVKDKLFDGSTDVVMYKLDTYEGSSGSPLLYIHSHKQSEDAGVVVMAVHRKEYTRYNEGSVLTQVFLNELRKALYDYVV